MNFFHQADPDSNIWICKCGISRTNNGSGYTNLVTHVTKQQTMSAFCAEHENKSTRLHTTASSTKTFYFTSKAVQLHDGLN